jgi:Tfp pilus assembly protein PilO
MQIKNRQQILTIGTIAVVGVLLADRLVFSRLTKTWKERTTRIAQLTESIKQGGLLVAREEHIQNRWEAMKTNSLPADTSKAESLVTGAISRWEIDSGIRFNSLRPQWKHNADDYMTLECRTDASGNIESISKFIYDLETDSLPIKVEELEVTSRDAGGQQISLVLRVSGLLITPQEEQ